MKKDVTVAICAGFVLGIIVALTATNLPNILKIKIPTTGQTPSPTAPEVKTPLPNLDLTVDSPKEESISDSKTATVSGHAKGGQTVLIETADNYDTPDIEASGKFTSKLDLAEGVNTVYFTLYDDNGNSIAKTVNVYYTTEKL